MSKTTAATSPRTALAPRRRGRPRRLSEATVDRIRQLAATGMGWTAIAKAVGDVTATYVRQLALGLRRVDG